MGQREVMRSRRRGAMRPSFASFDTLKERGCRESRMRAAPAVSCANSHETNAHEHTGQRRQSGFPCAMLYGLYRDLPGDRAFLPPSPARLSASLTPASGCQDHTAFPYATTAFVIRRHCVTASHRAFVTIAIRPSHRVRRAKHRSFFWFWKSEYFCLKGLTFVSLNQK